jgi:hypothetical protein
LPNLLFHLEVTHNNKCPWFRVRSAWRGPFELETKV